MLTFGEKKIRKDCMIVMRNMTDINYYISDVKDDMAFSVAYKASKDSKNNKELCACVVHGLINSVSRKN
jgi:hypothetical protein